MKKINKACVVLGRGFTVLVLILLITVSFLSCSKSGSKTRVLTTVTGVVHVYGKSPTSFVGIVDKNQKGYILNGDKDVIKKLTFFQEHDVSVSGTLIQDKSTTTALGTTFYGILNIPSDKYVVMDAN